MTRVDDFMLNPHFAVGSWRDDAEVDDQPTTATRRRPIEVSPGVWIYPEFYDRLVKAQALASSAEWNMDNAV